MHKLKKQRDAELLKHLQQGGAENERLKAELTSAQAEFGALQEQNRQLGVKCQNLETKMSTLQTQLYVAKLDKEKYFEELKDLKDAEAHLETRSVMSSSSRGPQASAFKMLNARLSKMVVEMGSVKADLEAQKKKVEARESEIKSKDSLVKTLQANAATLQEKLDEAKKQRFFKERLQAGKSERPPVPMIKFLDNKEEDMVLTSDEDEENHPRVSLLQQQQHC